MAKKLTLSSLILQQNVLSILLLTLVVIMFWVGISIYFSYSRTTVTPTDAALIAPLTPRLDSNLFERLKSRKSWSQAELSSFSPTVALTVTETPAPTVNPESTPEATSRAQPL